ncbi:hypothetical protein AMAG_06276 [Allomyces macrogynus ATCC 38327]|uniref:Nuclear speckle splicing regulatory protein 1 N-terminal domain-containing protein n=1 Tax=Allomyces macrogynus (strain ATCC 38327) TaxID=578462 RepID=A0A0L0SG41_ALLM3|nr:hypothetical protein AMAG_06276 [Allomyces macrogynus ATCC 38327]|eukprot:KNE61453.1 hypothetical protein AMAG_06276 [Allomyces macrogynus ATCC 38327]
MSSLRSFGKPPPPKSAAAPGAASPKLGLGLNLRGKRAKSRAFDEDDAAEEEKPTGSSAPAVSSSSRTPANLLRVDPTGAHSMAAKKVAVIQQQALEQDATAFDYDGVYDAMKDREARSKAVNKDDKRPKYMENLIRSAQVRKIDRLRAQETKYKRERADEDDEFADKEAFVTGAYREALEEVRRMEEEEARRDAADAAKRGEHGMAAFYRTFLDRTDADHKAAEHLEGVDPAAAASFAAPADAETEPPKPSAQDLAGMGVAVNASGEVVDKRQLLGAGLNVVRKPVLPAAPASSSVARVQRRDGGRRHNRDRERDHGRDQRPASPPPKTKELLDQKRRADEERAREEEAARAKLAKQSTEQTVSDARARYLARKAAAAAAAETTTAQGTSSEGADAGDVEREQN